MDNKTKKLLLSHLKEYKKYMAATKKSPDFKRRALANPQINIVVGNKIKELDYLIITVKEE